MYSLDDLFRAFKSGINLSDSAAIDPKSSFKKWLKTNANVLTKQVQVNTTPDLGTNSSLEEIVKEFHKKHNT